MKQLLLTILILLAGLQAAFAQQMKVLAGCNISRNMGGGGSESVTGNILAGYRIGLTTNIPLRKTGYCSLETGMLLNEWGSSFPQASTGQNTDGNETPSNMPLRFRYIELPLLLSNRFRLSPFNSIQLGAGPYIACRINTPSQIFIPEQSGNHYQGFLYAEKETEYSYERMDYGLSFNGSFDIQSKFSICWQYEYGLRNIVGYGSDINLRNQSFSLSLDFYLKR